METPYGGPDHPMSGCALGAAEGLRAGACRPRSGGPPEAGNHPPYHAPPREPLGPLSPTAPPMIHYVRCAYVSLARLVACPCARISPNSPKNVHLAYTRLAT